MCIRDSHAIAKAAVSPTERWQPRGHLQQQLATTLFLIPELHRVRRLNKCARTAAPRLEVVTAKLACAILSVIVAEAQRMNGHCERHLGGQAEVVHAARVGGDELGEDRFDVARHEGAPLA